MEVNSMNYYNPMQNLFNNNRQQPQVSEDQFLSIVSTLDRNSLQRLVAQARAKGISENDIKAGLEIMLKK